jgi:hypothetical protein
MKEREKASKTERKRKDEPQKLQVPFKFYFSGLF